MSDTVFVNGTYCSADEAKVSIFDRGFLFADAIYEVAAVLDGKLIDAERHLARLSRSLDNLDIPHPMTADEIIEAMRQIVVRNDLKEGMVYLQVSRGAAVRDFVMPKDAKPTVIMFPTRKVILQDPKAETGLRVMSTPDIRWKRGDIKSIALLGASMAKTAAKEAGYDDAFMVLDGKVTEGTSNNAFIVTADGKLVTRGLGSEILAGITRRAVIDIADELGIVVEERPFTIEEAQAAKEAFITSASMFVCAVVEVDDVALGSGKPGAVTKRIRERYIEIAQAEAI